MPSRIVMNREDMNVMKNAFSRAKYVERIENMIAVLREYKMIPPSRAQRRLGRPNKSNQTPPQKSVRNIIGNILVALTFPVKDAT